MENNPNNRTNYPFSLVDYDRPGALEDKTALLRRPFARFSRSLAEGAAYFVPGRDLEISINTAIAVGDPLLVTGEPGTGKTQTAYYVAHKLGVWPVLHFQVKSDSAAQDLLYHFDAVRYFHKANLKSKIRKIDKSDYVEKRPLWEAFESEYPRVLLIDEIDKAPRDFPNDLLHELDQMEFAVVETGRRISGTPENRPVVIVTSNSERRLPEPFLRRCVYHHIEFNTKILVDAVEKRRKDYQNLSDGFVKKAIERFIALRAKNLRKRPSTGEFLVWLRVLALTLDVRPAALDRDLSKLPYIGVLLKDHQDIEDLK